jgi:hypothetical protein
MAMHVVHTEIFELTFSSVINSWQLQKQITELNSNLLLPACDVILDKYDVANEIILFDKLEINIGTIDKNKLDSQLVARVIAGIENALQSQFNRRPHSKGGPFAKDLISNDIFNSITYESHEIDIAVKKLIQLGNDELNVATLFYFLIKGTLPWWERESFNIETVLNTTIRKHKNLLVSLLSRHRDKKIIAERIINQLSERSKFEFLKNVCDEKNSMISYLEIFTQLDLIKKVPSSMALIDNYLREIIICIVRSDVDVNENRFNIWEDGVIKVISDYIDNFTRSGTIDVIDDVIKRVYNQSNSFQKQNLLKLINRIEYIRFTTDIQILELFADYLKDKKNQDYESHFRTGKNGDREIHFNNNLSNVKPARTKIHLKNELLSNEGKIDETSMQLVKDINNLIDISEDKETYQINNAGVIIIWPFLGTLFERCKLTEKGKFLSEEAKIKAVYLLHYSVFKDLNPPEFLLILEKLLCGIDINESISKNVTISHQDMIEIESMFSELIKQWEAPGTISIDGLRMSFLERKGILSRKDDTQWVLTIEGKAWDILLDRIPWGISMVYLSWMKSILGVEWQRI